MTLDLDTANPDLLISGDKKKMRCGYEREDVPNLHQRCDGWLVYRGPGGLLLRTPVLGGGGRREGLAAGRGQGVKSLNTDEGYLTLRLERGPELKALTVPFTAATGPHPPQGGHPPGTTSTNSGPSTSWTAARTSTGPSHRISMGKS